MSKCKTYTKIPGNENLAKPKSPKKEIPISLMTDKELIYNQCKYTRDGTPTHIAKKNNAYDWSSNSTCKTYTKIPSNKNIAKQKSPQKLSIPLMTDEELIYNQCIYTRDGTPTHEAKKINQWMWDTMSKCKTYTKIPPKSDKALVFNERAIDVNENEENLKKLHSLIMSNKDILKSKYIKISDKQEKITIPVNFNINYRRSLVLAVYLNYENVLKQIESDPNFTDLGKLHMDGKVLKKCIKV